MRKRRRHKRGTCRECESRAMFKVIAGSAVVCVTCAACGSVVVPPPAEAAAASRPGVVLITKLKHALHWPDHADPKHVEADEPPEFVPPPPLVGMMRPVRARLLQQPRGRIYTTPVPPPPPAPPPQPARRGPVQARQLRQPRGRISGPVPPARLATPPQG